MAKRAEKGREGPPVMSFDPKCACCGNAYGTRWLCVPCAADPANAGWAEADEVELSWPSPPDDRGTADLSGDVPVWNPTDLQRAILRLSLAEHTVRGIAGATGSSEKHVRKTLKQFQLLRKS